MAMRIRFAIVLVAGVVLLVWYYDTRQETAMAPPVAASATVAPSPAPIAAEAMVSPAPDRLVVETGATQTAMALPQRSASVTTAPYGGPSSVPPTLAVPNVVAPTPTDWLTYTHPSEVSIQYPAGWEVVEGDAQTPVLFRLPPVQAGEPEHRVELEVEPVPAGEQRVFDALSPRVNAHEGERIELTRPIAVSGAHGSEYLVSVWQPNRWAPVSLHLLVYSDVAGLIIRLSHPIHPDTTSGLDLKRLDMILPRFEVFERMVQSIVIPSGAPIAEARTLNALAVPPSSMLPNAFSEPDPSPDGRWWTLKQVRVDPDTVQQPLPATLEVWNSQSGATWVAAISGTLGIRQHVWLPAGQLLWQEQGRVLLADADGGNRRDLAAPEPVLKILGAGANGVAVVLGEMGLWRLETAAGRWERVPEPVAGPAPATSYPRSSYDLALTEDGTAAALMETWAGLLAPADVHHLVHLPLVPGEPPVILTALDAALLPTMEAPVYRPEVEALRGGRWRAGHIRGPLVDSPYWVRVPYLIPTDSEPFPYLFVLVDSRDGSYLPASSVVPVPNGLEIQGIGASPDRRWFIAALGEPFSFSSGDYSRASLHYVAPSHDLSAGRIIQGQLVQWQSEPPAVFVTQRGAEERLVRVPLPQGEPVPLLSRVEPKGAPTPTGAPHGARLRAPAAAPLRAVPPAQDGPVDRGPADREQPVWATDQAIFVADRGYLHAFTAEGQPLRSIRLRPGDTEAGGYEEDMELLGSGLLIWHASGTRLYFNRPRFEWGNAGWDPASPLWVWDVGGLVPRP